MKKSIFILFTFFTLCSATAQDFKTLTYFVNDSTKLELDLFLPKTKSTNKLPLLIHVHGGGFSGGRREDGHHIAKHAATQGYAAASISYTLYMKGRKFSCDGILSQKTKAFQIAANQLWQATLFFITNADKYNIDTTKIFISGSSAGAETALHAAFWDRNVMALYPQKLPDTFKYAGIASGSGAIMDLNLITKQNLIPALFFHGSCDRTVPYGTAAHHYCPANASGWLMLFGSYSLYNHIIGLNGSTHLYTFCGGGHEYSDELFAKQPQEIVDFMNRVLHNQKEQAHTIIATGKPCKTAEYNFCD
ncbi:alpha/beta hydrolase [Flavobacterium subsaxonicum]|uniref:Esterase n=1 Tax=Flavobacterium subsaxonicum WB 4.1-42 = DSM 21790 TaxID=1121898 RepID=A0A0A2MJE0_9FLAO|nr:alpha/beta hydrolase [Flavobacterium subsaxonicum]KGO91598.1 esterase [Flavobacterium subsaxonicum WB 4.1-42 = DSM 21790]